MHKNQRAEAAKIIHTVIHKHESLSGITHQDPLVKAMAYGVIRHLPRLQFYASQLLKQPLSELEEIIQTLLFVGIYQLTEMKVSDHAAVSETVEAARKLNKQWACKLINAILRNFMRQKETLMKKANQDITAKLNHPTWLTDLIKDAWPDHWQTILEANNIQAPMFLRVNSQQTTANDYLALLQQHDIEATAIDNIASCIKLTKPVSVNKLPNFDSGAASVQDLSAQRVAKFMDLKPGMHILDACAAPGGKTMHILESTKNLTVTALDIDKQRTKKIAENLDRAKLSANIMTADAAQPQAWWDKKPFDRILVDAPCSGTGVIRRHPDIKVLRRKKDFFAFPKQQLALLNALWPLLKPQGLLVYTTCSIMPCENEEVIKTFLNEHQNATSLPLKLPKEANASYGWQVFPEAEGGDGFYYCVLQKT